MIAEARGGLEDLSLTVAAHNQAAIRLYRAHGFTELGAHPHALKLGDAYVDEILMRLVL